MLTPTIPEGFPPILTGLGAPVRYFPVRKFNKIGSLVMFIVFLAGALAVLIYGLYRAYTAYWQHGAAVIGSMLSTPLILAAVLFLLAVLGGWLAYSNWNRGVLLCEKGFAIRSRKGIQEWRWEEITSIKVRITRQYANGVYTGTTHEYMLVNNQNGRVTINEGFQKVVELGEVIESSVFPLLYEPAAEQYNQGKPVAFGPVVISKLGLHFGKKTIPWEEIKEVSLQRGDLKVSRKEGGWFSGASVPAPVIPNLRVLLAILKQVVGLKTD